MTPPDTRLENAAPADLTALPAALPLGTSRGTAAGKHYVATCSLFNGRRSTKLVAGELGGPDYISLNFYDPTAGPRLYPCGMPAAKVITFLRNYVPEPAL